MTSRLERGMSLTFFLQCIRILLELSYLKTVNTIFLISTANQQPNLSSFTLSQQPFIIQILFRAPAPVSSLFLSYSNGLTNFTFTRLSLSTPLPSSLSFPYLRSLPPCPFLRPFIPLLSFTISKNTNLHYITYITHFTFQKVKITLLAFLYHAYSVFLFPASYYEEKRDIIL